MKTTFSLMALCLCLVACGEKPQTLGNPRSDTAPYTGTTATAFASPGWKAGDKISWEQQLRARGQYGQNDYTRAP